MEFTVSEDKLLFGMFAWRAGFITQPQLRVAIRASASAPEKDFATVLVDEEIVDQDTCDQITTLFGEQLTGQQKGLDSSQTLQASITHSTFPGFSNRTLFGEKSIDRSIDDGQVFHERFQIHRLLGQGGMGRVFLAFDPRLEREVAIKVPLFDLKSDETVRQRFLREGRAAGGIRHPNVVAVYEISGLDEECFIVSEYVAGPTLKQWMEEHDEPIPPQVAAQLVLSLAHGVQAAHEVLVVHRDLKPANVLLDISEAGELGTSISNLNDVCHGAELIRPRITDFGLAGLAEVASDLTMTGTMIGTAAYMSPEQIQGQVTGP